jgi:hypothetical protein
MTSKSNTIQRWAIRNGTPYMLPSKKYFQGSLKFFTLQNNIVLQQYPPKSLLCVWVPSTISFLFPMQPDTTPHGHTPTPPPSACRLDLGHHGRHRASSAAARAADAGGRPPPHAPRWCPFGAGAPPLARRLHRISSLESHATRPVCRHAVPVSAGASPPGGGARAPSPAPCHPLLMAMRCLSWRRPRPAPSGGVWSILEEAAASLR